MKTDLNPILCAGLATALTAGALPAVPAAMTIDQSPFGKTPSGEEATFFTLDNGKGMVVQITDYGGTVVSVVVPDKHGQPGEVVLGFDTLDDYLTRSPFFGCITGRYANRIAGGTFTLDGKEYTLATNNGPNHLHGGKSGFDKFVWDAETGTTEDGARLVLTRTSPDGEEGYPGNLKTKVTYTVTADNALRIDYEATTDKPTVVNLTNHSYFNLEGAGSGDVLGHLLELQASMMTPTDEHAIPTGEVVPVKGSPFDFTTAKPLADGIDSDHQQIKFGNGFDHNFVIDGEPGTLRPAAKVTAPNSGRVMEVETTEPGVQLYTANFMKEMAGRDGETYGHRHGLCLETQHFPDSPNKPSFPSTVLRPGESYRSTTLYRFSLKDS